MAEIKTLTVNGKTYTVADPDAAHIDDSAVGENAWSSGQIAQTAANALKGAATGNPVCLADVSPLPHEMAVKLSSDTAEVSSVTVTKCGFNWFDQETELAKFGLSKQEDGSWLGGGNTSGKSIYPPAAVQGAVYVQITAKAASTISVPLVLRTFYTDGTSAEVLKLVKETTEFTTIKGVTDPQKTVNYIRLSYGGSTPDPDSYYIRDVMMSYADGAYVPYTAEPQTFTPNADGTVNGIPGNGEAMTLVADAQGVTITAQYNKDTNKVLEKLIQAVRFLGGDV